MLNNGHVRRLNEIPRRFAHINDRKVAKMGPLW
jgi:hypothetical protein